MTDIASSRVFNSSFNSPRIPILASSFLTRQRPRRSRSAFSLTSWKAFTRRAGSSSSLSANDIGGGKTDTLAVISGTRQQCNLHCVVRPFDRWKTLAPYLIALLAKAERKPKPRPTKNSLPPSLFRSVGIGSFGEIVPSIIDARRSTDRAWKEIERKKRRTDNL